MVFSSRSLVFVKSAFSTQNLNVSSSKTPTLTHLIIHPHNLSDTHLITAILCQGASFWFEIWGGRGS